MIRKLALVTTLAIAATFSAFSQGIYNFPEDNYDFGVIEEGEIAAHEFEFSNTGKDSIKLKRENIRPSCGCTTPKVTEGSIAPQGKGKITAEYNTNGRVGNFVKTINIFEDNNIVKVLTIKGIVIKKEEAQPSVTTEAGKKVAKVADKKEPKISLDKKDHYFGKIEKGQMVTSKFTVKNVGKDTLKINSAQAACNCINHKLISGKDNATVTYILPGKSATLEVTYNPQSKGKARDVLTLFTNDPTNKRVPIALTADVVESLIEKSPVKQDDQGSPFQK
jgi:hypothetical protein